MTGADLYGLCSDAWMTALKRSIMLLEQQEQLADVGGGSNSEGNQEVVVTHADFLGAAASLQPSLGADELAEYERIRAEYEGAAIATQ